MLEPDLLIDRRRLKRRLNFWRLVAVVAVIAVIGVATRPIWTSGAWTLAAQHVARVNVNGVITEDRKLTDAIVALAKDRSVPAVILSVDSPGGSVAGGESLHAALVQVAAAKPLVAVMRGTAASAGYMISVPAARIFAREATLTGSIGVILQTVELSGLLKTLGVDAVAVTSGPLKDQPSLTRPLTPQGREYLDGVVRDMYDQFVDMVVQGRHMDTEAVRKLADGRAYTGRQAKALGLVDEIGGETEARAWLDQTHQIARSLPIRDVQTSTLYERTLGASLGSLRSMLIGAALPEAWAMWTGR